jgi:hypothetical protein
MKRMKLIQKEMEIRAKGKKRDAETWNDLVYTAREYSSSSRGRSGAYCDSRFSFLKWPMTHLHIISSHNWF